MTRTDLPTTELDPPRGSILPSVIADALAPVVRPCPGPPAGHPRPRTPREAAPAGPGRPAPWWLGLVVLVEAASTMALSLWRAGGTPVEPYYAAAARSMAASWHNLLFGAFDPAGTVTMDKLPVAFWPQALLVRLAGFHPWVLVLPQVLEGGATVVVLVAAVRRCAGWRAGLVAGGVLAVSPAWVLLDRGTMPDTLMTLCLALAADQVTRLLRRPGRPGPVLAAALFVGLGFEAKMGEAWLVLPALGAAVWAAGPGTARRRHLATAGAVLVAASLAWAAAVSLVPAHDRPYVDGSTSDSVLQQVLVYNGTARFGAGSATAQESAGLGPADGPGPGRLLTGLYGRSTSWLLPPALVVGVGGVLLAWRRRRRWGRAGPALAGVVLWAGWAALYAGAFSTGTAIAPYYTGAMAPPVAALCGIGAAAWWTGRRRPAVAWAGAGTAVAAGLWVLVRLPASGTGLPAWAAVGLCAVAVGGAVAAVGSALATGRRGVDHRGSAPAGTGRRPEASSPAARTRGAARIRGAARRAALAGAGVLCGAAGMVAVPAAASAGAAATQLGPFDTPFEPPAADHLTHVLVRLPSVLAPAVDLLERVEPPTADLLATDTAELASVFIAMTGREVYPIGGATGRAPAPTLAALRAQVADGMVRIVVTGPSADPRIAWLRAHCAHVPLTLPGVGSVTADRLLHAVTVLVCAPASASAGARTSALRRAAPHT